MGRNIHPFPFHEAVSRIIGTMLYGWPEERIANFTKFVLAIWCQFADGTMWIRKTCNQPWTRCMWKWSATWTVILKERYCSVWTLDEKSRSTMLWMNSEKIKIQRADGICVMYMKAKNHPSVQPHLEAEQLEQFLGSYRAVVREMNRAVFNLFVVDGYGHDEIADMLKISAGTSKAHLHRAKTIERIVGEKKKINQFIDNSIFQWKRASIRPVWSGRFPAGSKAGSRHSFQEKENYLLDAGCPHLPDWWYWEVSGWTKHILKSNEPSQK